MKNIAAMLSLVALSGCSTIEPSHKADPPRPAKLQSPTEPASALASMDIRGVHGQVEYWNGTLWAGLRPNMVFTNGTQIRPGADSYVDLSAGRCVTVRLMADNRMNVTALMVRHGKTRTAPATDGSVIPASGEALQIQAGGVMGRLRGADFAIYSDGNVQAVSGEVMVTGGGKTCHLRDGQCLDANIDGSESGSRSSLQEVSPQPVCACLVVCVPQPERFELGMANPWRGTARLGE
jgi:hypothetical protein